MIGNTFKRAIIKSGNQYTITIPRKLVDEMKLVPKEDVNVTYDQKKNAIIITKNGGIIENE